MPLVEAPRLLVVTGRGGSRGATRIPWVATRSLDVCPDVPPLTERPPSKPRAGVARDGSASRQDTTMNISLVSCALAVGWLAISAVAQPLAENPEPATVAHVDIDGDGQVDVLRQHADGRLQVALQVGPRLFEPVLQDLPSVPQVADVLVADLDGDRDVDLYIVSKAENLALLGDGTGRLRQETEALGLADAGAGESASLMDIDQDGRLDILLDNGTHEVAFYNEGGRYLRDPAAPVSAKGTATGGDKLAAWLSLLAQADDVLAPDQELVIEELVIVRDGAGLPQLVLRSRSSSSASSGGRPDGESAHRRRTAR